MNYYPFHLGDYAAHTAHLEPMEDLAYRRMLDLYYRTEKALSYDWRDVARLIRMKDYPQAIEAVLAEFFTLTDEGWVHTRCDAEIAKMRDKQAKAKASAVASVNARSTNAQRTLNGRSTEVELPTPTPTPTPEEKERALQQQHSADAARALLEAEGHKPTPAGSICKAMRAVGLSATNPGDPRLTTLIEQGATEAEFVGIAEEAAKGGKGFAWVLHVLAARRTEAAAIKLAPVDAVPWHETRQGIEAKGVDLGIGKWDEIAFSEGRGMQWPVYRSKVFAAAGVDQRVSA